MDHKVLSFSALLLMFLIKTVCSEEDEWIKNSEVELPSNLQICKRSLPADERNMCIKNSINSLLPSLKNGYPSLGIPSIDPHKTKQNYFEFKTAGIQGKLDLIDESISGLTDAKIRNVKSKVNDKNLYMELDILIPILHTDSKYKGEIKYFDFLLKPNGHFNASIIDISYICKFLAKINKTNEEEYMIVKSLDISNIKINDFKLSVTGLIPDPDVNTFALEFINSNWRLLYPEIARQTKSIWEPMYIKIMNYFFARVPFRRLMPKE